MFIPYLMKVKNITANEVYGSVGVLQGFITAIVWESIIFLREMMTYT